MPWDETIGNGLTQHWYYNPRDQVTEIKLWNKSDTTNAASRMDLLIDYTQAGVQTADNGNVVRLVDALGGTGQAYDYYYDGLNRLDKWTTDSGQNCPFALDQYGNISDASGDGCGTIGGLSFNANNQIVGYVYGAGGDLLSDTSGTGYTWDGNDELVGFAVPDESATYLYDGLLRRLSKADNGATIVYARDPLGRTAAKLENGTWTDYVFAEQTRVAAVPGPRLSTVYFLAKDQVGTTRAVTDENANNRANCNQDANYPNGSFLTYSPFGTPMDCQQSATGYLFTGKMQDGESGLAHFQYRKYASLEARWLSPDPAGVKATCPRNPQSQNRYGYAGNAPAQFTDNRGLLIAVPTPFPEPIGFCEPDDYTIDIDGMEAPPCPYLVLPTLLLSRVVTTTPGCTCKRATPVPAGHLFGGTCGYDCTCPKGAPGGPAVFEYPGLNEKCGPLRETCPRYVEATRVAVDLYFFGAVLWKLNGCIR